MQHIVEVYRFARANGAIETADRTASELGLGVDEVLAAVRHLTANQLLRSDGRLVPIDPEIAAAALVSSVEREIYQRRDHIDQIREHIGGLGADLPDTTGSAFLSADYLIDTAEVRGFLKCASDTCRKEVLVLLSGDDEAAELDLLTSAHLPLDRDVIVRVVCRHRDRADLASRVRLKRLVEAGAAVRTVSYVPRPAAVFDQTQAVLFGLPGPRRPGVARVTNLGIVAFLLDMFNHLWDGATPLYGADPGYSGVAEDLQRTIAGLMAEGYTDEVIARRLDMSVRTCRRHIAALLRDLDAISRFQAGVLAARRYFADETG